MIGAHEDTKTQSPLPSRGEGWERGLPQHAPAMNPYRKLITGVVCGVRVEEVEEETMRENPTLEKLIDELARGKAMEKILRG